MCTPAYYTIATGVLCTYSYGSATYIGNCIECFLNVLQHVPQSFWGSSLLKVVVVCCLQPSSAGFDVGDVTLTESLTAKVNDYSM